MNGRILLVDDDHDNSSIFRIALEDNEYQVDIYNDPQLALSAYKPDYYDLLILDIHMPKMSGYELYDKIRKIDDKVKVCFLTASEYRQYGNMIYFNLYNACITSYQSIPSSVK